MKRKIKPQSGARPEGTKSKLKVKRKAKVAAKAAVVENTGPHISMFEELAFMSNDPWAQLSVRQGRIESFETSAAKAARYRGTR
jgi:hypothetical protein